MPQAKSTELVDGLFSFPGGVNGGIAVVDLPKTQLQSAENITLRGNFARPRPPYYKTVLSAALPASLFQGCCYFAPDVGPECIMVAIGGRLFQLTPSGLNVTVTEQTIPGDSNPATYPQAWLWQAEKWVIWNDGFSIPVIFDGVSSRRTLQFQSASYVIVTGGAAPGAVGGTVTLVLNNPYTNGPDYPVFISNGTNQDQYTFSPFAGATITLENITDTVGKIVLGGTNIVYDPNFVGKVVSAVSLGFGIAVVGLDQPYFGRTGVPIFSDNTIYPQGGVIKSVSANKMSLTISFQGSGFGQSGQSGADLIPGTFAVDPPVGSTLTTTGLGSKIVVGTLPATSSGGFTVPAQGATVIVDSTIQFPTQIGLPCSVFVGNARYIVTAINNNVSNQVVATLVAPATVGVNPIAPGNTVTSRFSGNELPPGKMGVYGLGRNWICLPDGRTFIASDIVGGSSGTVLNNFRDAVLKVAENTYLVGGGSFVVPGNVGEIKAMKFVATLDASLGQGPLQVLTPKIAFSCQAPVDRTIWAFVQNPILTESLITNGATAQDSTVSVNGDLMFRSIDGLRSLILGRRDFATWGNVPISREVQDIIDQDPPDLLAYASASDFDNRLLLTTGAVAGPLGTYFQSLIALNFDPISTLRGKAPSIYDGQWDGLNILKLVKGDFAGVERQFAFTFNSATTSIELYEIAPSKSVSPTPITWTFAPAIIDFGEKDPRTRQLKKLMDGEIYLDEITPLTDANGNNIPIEILVEFRPDYDTVWHEWIKIKIASDAMSYQPRIGLDEPPRDSSDDSGRPWRVGYAFQVQITITGNARFMGARFLCNIEADPRFAPVPGQIE